MHTEILTAKQRELLPLIKKFSPNFYLVGGTALALQLGHRRSIDFDLFTENDFKNESIINLVSRFKPIKETFINARGELTLKVNQVRMTFYQFAFTIPHPIQWKEIITMSDDLTIAAMKAYALGQRAKWKDYVDLYFVFKKHSFAKVISRAKKLFPNLINERQVREQINYFADINYSETVKYLPGMAVSDKEIQTTLKQLAIS